MLLVYTHSMEVTVVRLLMNFWYGSLMKCIMSISGTLSAGCLVSTRNHAVLVRIGRAGLVVASLHSIINYYFDQLIMEPHK